MIESKILNWMLRGPIELLDVYRSIEPTLLLESFSKKNKGLLKVVQDYHSKYKTPPSRVILEGLLNEKDLESLAAIYEDECAQNEIQFYVDEQKKLFNKHLANELSKIIDASGDNLANINQNLRNVVVKIEKLGKDISVLNHLRSWERTSVYWRARSGIASGSSWSGKSPWTSPVGAVSGPGLWTRHFQLGP